MKGVQMLPVSREMCEKALRPDANGHFPFIILLLDTSIAEVTEDGDERLVIEPKKRAKK